MQELERGSYRLRYTECGSELQRIQAFRSRCFRLKKARDADSQDETCLQILVEDSKTGALVCCYRITELDAARLSQSYAAQFYDLSALAGFRGKMLEVGRFCIDPERSDPDILRLAWAGLADHVDQHGIKLLFGCTSFLGNTPECYDAAFALLSRQYLAPDIWAPGAKAREVHHFAQFKREVPDREEAMRQMPPLLRSYLAMGARVSDHAVIDRALNTLHVFTGLDVDAVPEGRKRLLRAI